MAQGGQVFLPFEMKKKTGFAIQNENI